MAAKRKYNKKSEYWNRFDKKETIEQTLAANPLLQNSTYNPSLEGEAYFLPYYYLCRINSSINIL